MNKQDLIQKLKTLDGLSADEKSALINLVNTKKKYGLVWEDKIEDVEEELREKLPVFKEVKERAILSTDNNAPNHILIEGDNLHALTALMFTHEGSIDVICIDPPYNTGNKDFKYNDRFVDKEDSYRHSKWLSFMHKRLQIAKRLLRDDGVIFVNIDDNENAQIKLLLEEVFGQQNFVSNLIWQCKKGGGNDSRYIAIEHEYILCFSKNKNETPSFFEPYTDDYLKRYKEIDKDGKFYWDTFKRKSGKQYYPIMCPDGTFLEFDELGNKISWLRSEPRFLADLIKGEIKIEQRNNSWSIMFKQRLPEGKKPRSLHLDLGTTSSGSEQILDLFSSHVFSNPKPIDLIKQLISYPSKSLIILDFFSGSGTTLHATMQLNEEDGGNRQCILVTNNENNICEEVTYERNKRVIQGYTNAKGVEVKGLPSNNLRYYKSEYVSRETSLKNKRQLTLLATELLSIKEDCYNDITTEFSLEKWLKLFSNTNGKLVCVIYDDVEIETGITIIKNVLAKYKPSQKIKVYVFSNGQYPYTEDFEDVLEHIELCALPDAIYKAYQNVLPKRKRTDVPEIEDPTAEEVETATDLFNQNSEN